MPYRRRLRRELKKQEMRLFKRLNTPQKIQDWLDALPLNFESGRETYMSPRRVIRGKRAHCFEGALVAAAALAYHGQRPLLLDLQTVKGDDDHVVALFKQRGLWGAISKTNHAILRYRDPVYRSVRELAMSYFHEYMLENGKKTMTAYSTPFALSKYPPEMWVTAEEDLDWLVTALDVSKHFLIARQRNMQLVRRGSEVERRALKHVEWRSQGKRSRR
jgi:hypothetical protein